MIILIPFSITIIKAQLLLLEWDTLSSQNTIIVRPYYILFKNIMRMLMTHDEGNGKIVMDINFIMGYYYAVLFHPSVLYVWLNSFIAFYGRNLTGISITHVHVLTEGK